MSRGITHQGELLQVPELLASCMARGDVARSTRAGVGSSQWFAVSSGGKHSSPFCACRAILHLTLQNVILVLEVNNRHKDRDISRCSVLVIFSYYFPKLLFANSLRVGFYFDVLLSFKSVALPLVIFEGLWRERVGRNKRCSNYECTWLDYKVSKLIKNEKPWQPQ